MVNGGCHFCSSSQIPPLPPDGRAPTGHRGEGRRLRSGSPVAWFQSRQQRHRLLIRVPGRSEPHAQAPPPTPCIRIYNLHRAALTHPCVRTRAHRRAGSPTPDTRRDPDPLARSTPTPAGARTCAPQPPPQHTPTPGTHACARSPAHPQGSFPAPPPTRAPRSAQDQTPAASLTRCVALGQPRSPVSLFLICKRGPPRILRVVGDGRV